MVHLVGLAFVACLASLVRAAPTTSQTSVTLLFQNNLNASDDANHVGALLLDSMRQTDAANACKSFGESLLPASTLKTHQTDFVQALSYNAFAGRASAVQLYYIDGGAVAVAQNLGDFTFQAFPFGNVALPVLCTQSSNQDQPGNAVATPSNQVAVASGGNTFIGFRNQKSFRFLGIPYADPPKRFVYSTLFSPKGQTIQATAYGSQCAQVGGVGGEDCLFLNIQTPFIPKVGSKSELRPVMFWIHGGGFTVRGQIMLCFSTFLLTSCRAAQALTRVRTGETSRRGRISWL